jgi:subtilisin family serine protease
VVPIGLFDYLAEQDYVLYIELETRSYGGDDDQSMALKEGNILGSGSARESFSGASTILGVIDTGFMLGSAASTMHNDLNKYGCGENFTSDEAEVWNDQHDHGTHVLGSIAGTGTADSRYRGTATGIGGSSSTRIRAGKIWDNSNSSPTSAWMRNDWTIWMMTRLVIVAGLKW